MEKRWLLLPTEADFEGLKVLVTGGTRGIGRVIAQAFSSVGAHVILTGTNRESVEQAASELTPNAVGIQCDQRIEEQIEELFTVIESRLGGIDILINNAARGLLPQPLRRVSFAALEDLFRTNLFGPIAIESRAAGLMARQPSGRSILNIASVSGYGGAQYLAPYAATKAALINFTKSMAREWSAEKHKSNALSIGPVRTEMFTAIANSSLFENYRPVSRNKTCCFTRRARCSCLLYD